MYALGGSTNGVLHLLAMAKELVHQVISSFLLWSYFNRAGVTLSIEEFNTIGERTPLIGNLKPHGKVVIIIVLLILY